MSTRHYGKNYNRSKEVNMFYRRMSLFFLVGSLVITLILGNTSIAWGEEIIEAPKSPPGGIMVNTTKYKTEPPYTIGYANASLSNTWRIFGLAHLYWAVSKYPQIKKVIHLNANDSVPKQISDMEDLLAMKVDAIVLAATSGSGLIGAIDMAMAQGVPIIVLERGVNTENYTTFIDTNPKEIATMQAEWVAEKMGGKGNVVLFGIIPGITISDWQENAVREVLSHYPDIKILDFQYSMVSRSKGKTIMESWLTTYPKIDGVIAWDGDTTQGAVEAAKSAGRYKEIKAWSGDDVMGYLKLIKEGLPGIAVPSPNYCTVEALKSAIKILRGEPVPKHWRVSTMKITAENVDEHYIEAAPPTWYLSLMPRDKIQYWVNEAAAK